MESQFERTTLLIGADGVKKLSDSGVVIFGLGGVGGQLTEALARAGIGRFLLVDFDRINLSNLNRQIIALHSTVGRLKTDAAKERILDINPAAEVSCREMFVDSGNIDTLDFSPYDYIADAVDSVEAKVAIIKKAKAENRPIISSMGAGNRLATDFSVVDINATYGCPLAKKMRTLLRKSDISDVKVVFSPTVMPSRLSEYNQLESGKALVDSAEMDKPAPQGGSQSSDCPKSAGIASKMPIGSISFAPPIAGLVMAAEIVKQIAGYKS